MSVLENLFVFYFYSFITILPFSLALKNIILLIRKDKKDSLGKKNMTLIISFVTVNLLITIGILLTIVFYNKIYGLIGEIMTYFLFFGIVVIAYGIISYLESIIATATKIYEKYVIKYKNV